MFSFYEIKERTIEFITDISIFIIKKINRYKNRCLSQRLFKVAETYNTMPEKYNYDTVSNENNEVNYMRKMSEKCLEHLDDLIFLVKNESDSQINKCGITKCTPAEWVTYLTKEVGEVADAISEREYRDGSDEKVVKEAIQVATLALKIAEMYLK